MSSEKPVVSFMRDGALVSVTPVSRATRDIVTKTLTYVRILRAQTRGEGRYVPQPVECFKLVQTPDKSLTDKFLLPAGFETRLRQAFSTAGFEVRTKVLRADLHPERLVPQWARLKDDDMRWKQRETLEKLLAVHYGRVQCPTAWGKSWSIAAICDLLPKAKIAVTTHSLDVLSGLHSAISKRVPLVGLVGGGKSSFGPRVTCVAGKSLQRITDPVDILICDEVHEFATDDYFMKFQNPSFRFARRWGLSASNGDRADKADFELEGVFGPVIMEMAYADAVANGCVAPLHVEWRNVFMAHDPTEGLTMDSAVERHGIWRNEHRNRLIADDARKFDDDTQVLISVKTIEHAVHLKKLLPEFSLCYSEAGMPLSRLRQYVKNGFLPANEPLMTRERREHLRKEFEKSRLKKVIANTVWNRGVDFRNLAVLIRADAASSAIANTQIPGRTARLGDSGKVAGLVIDYLDQFSSRLRSRAQRRRRDYAKHGWEQSLPTQSRLQAGGWF